MNIEKLIQLTAYLLKKYENRLNYTKLIKLLYLADRQAFKEIGLSLSGDVYYSLDNGPVLSGLLDLIHGNYKDKEAQSLWNARFARDSFDLISVVDRIPLSKLSEYDREVLDKVDSQFHNNDYSSLISYLHNKDNCPEWKNPNGSRLPIKIEDILANVGKSPEEINFIMQENNLYEEEEKLFAQLGVEIA